MICGTSRKEVGPTDEMEKGQRERGLWSTEGQIRERERERTRRYEEKLPTEGVI